MNYKIQKAALNEYLKLLLHITTDNCNIAYHFKQLDKKIIKKSNMNIKVTFELFMLSFLLTGILDPNKNYK